MNAKTLRGQWRIVEMDLRDADAMDLLGPAFIEFDGRTGSFRFIDVRLPAEGTKHDAGVQLRRLRRLRSSSGRSWAFLLEDGSLAGRIYFHLGNYSGFRAVNAER